MKTFTFTNRETYLAQRAEWKSQYRKVSEDIRAAKHLLKAAHRQSKNGVVSMSFYYNLWDAKSKARTMLELLKTAKEEAAKQYVTTKELTHENAM